MMKNLTLIIILLLCLHTLEGQKITEKHINFSGKESIEMDFQISDSIVLQTWDKNEVYAKASVNINENKDNDAYLITFSEDGKTSRINGEFKENYFRGKDNCCNKTDIVWQVFIPANAKFSMETINGNITITGKTGEMKVKSISGYIDLSVPTNKNADLLLSTITGTIYTDHNLKPDEKEGIHSRIRNELNDGGPEINLETISGDIFFRKE